MKQIIALSSRGNSGKSSVLNELYKLLTNLEGVNLQFDGLKGKNVNSDLRLVIEINGKVIVIESKGDPDSDLEVRLNEILNEYKPDMIVCTCRSSGETLKTVKNIADDNNADLLLTSPYQTETESLRSSYNKLKAKHIYQLILEL